MSGDEAIIAALTHMSGEIKGLRSEVRKVIELEAEARNHKEAIGRAFAEIKAVDARIDAVDVQAVARIDAVAVRVTTLEGQVPIANVVRGAVFAMIALTVVTVLAAVFSIVIRSPTDVVVQTSPAIGPPPRQQREQDEPYPRSQP